MPRRIASLWFPRLPSDRALRAHPVEAPFALTHAERNTNRIYCLNRAAQSEGLHRGMSLADARAFCPELVSRPARPEHDARFLDSLRRWATRWSPWVGIEGVDGLVLDLTGSTHLFGGEDALLATLGQTFERSGLTVRVGLADTRGAAWALARHGGGLAAPGETERALARLPVAALRIEEETVTALKRLGLRTIGELAGTPRAPVARRFGPELMRRLDQALGRQAEEITPIADPPHYGVRLTLPEPVGLTRDVLEGTARLLERLALKLRENEAGARILCLTLRRVDLGERQVELRLARPMRDAAEILPLFERGVGEVDAGYGIDQLRIEAVQVEPMPARQLDHLPSRRSERLDDLITRIGTRIGLENVLRFLPAESHIPDRSFIVAPAAYSEPGGGWATARPRPICLFPPEPETAEGTAPPQDFRWRNMRLATARATGPERIAPEWWFDDPKWRSGVRDYWRIETRQGRRLWMFHTPQDPGWFVQGEFP